MAHLEALGISSVATATLTSLADAVSLALSRDGLDSGAGGGGELLNCGVPGTSPSFFLSDVDIEPQLPPPTQVSGRGAVPATHSYSSVGTAHERPIPFHPQLPRTHASNIRCRSRYLSHHLFHHHHPRAMPPAALEGVH